MPWKYTEDYYREYTRVTWDEAAEAYRGFQTINAPVSEALVRALDAGPGDRILDLATGPGEPALSLATLVGPAGSVLGVDLSERMVAIARDEAGRRGLTNVEFRVMDATRLDLPPEAFSHVVSRFGFQIFTDPDAAAAEAHRVLRPGGRVAVAVWAAGNRSPALDVLLGPMLRRAEPDETGYLPSPFELGGPGEMLGFLTRSGFEGANESRLRFDWEFPDADAYLDAVLRGTPIGHSLGEETETVRGEILAETRANLRAYEVAGRLRLPAEAVIVTATRRRARDGPPAPSSVPSREVSSTPPAP